MNVTIFGAGAFGTALGEVLTDNGHIVSYYDPVKHPEQSLSAIIHNSEVNILATPSDAIGKLILFIPYDKPLICASKGFLSAEKFKDFKHFSVIAGATFAADLIAKKPTTLTATNEISGKLFKNDWLSIEYTNDILGVLLCGAFKNIYAIGAGFREINYEMPEFNDYIRSAYGEIRLILAANGADPSTANLACGFNDLVMSCASPASRNYRLGEELHKNPALAQGLSTGASKLDMTTEGYTALKALPTSGLQIPSEVTLLNEIYHLVFPPVEEPKKKRKR